MTSRHTLSLILLSTAKSSTSLFFSLSLSPVKIRGLFASMNAKQENRVQLYPKQRWYHTDSVVPLMRRNLPIQTQYTSIISVDAFFCRCYLWLSIQKFESVRFFKRNEYFYLARKDTLNCLKVTVKTFTLLQFFFSNLISEGSCYIGYWCNGFANVTFKIACIKIDNNHFEF